jgi:hypothetical protein
MLKLNKLYLMAIIVASIVFTTVTVEAYAGYWTTAYDVAFTHYESWWQPHYGAYFNGAYGSNQYFTGPSGQPAGYSSWNWWGNELHVLLLNKSWLLAPVCYDSSTGNSVCFDRWNGNNHHAYMDYH